MIEITLPSGQTLRVDIEASRVAFLFNFMLEVEKGEQEAAFYFISTLHSQAVFKPGKQIRDLSGLVIDFNEGKIYEFYDPFDGAPRRVWDGLLHENFTAMIDKREGEEVLFLLVRNAKELPST